MKTPLSIFCLLFLWNISCSYGQKCTVKSDPITGEKVIEFSNVYKTLRFQNKGTALTDFYTTFSYGGEQNVVIPKGSEIFFKLKNGKIIKLESITDTHPQTILSGDIILSRYTYAFQLTKEQMKDLASDKIVFMRYPSTDGGTLDYDVKGLGKVYTSKITKGAKCLAERL
ncbi:MAG: hypothetical protein ACRBFS_18125 [Aureispira sp.]